MKPNTKIQHSKDFGVNPPCTVQIKKDYKEYPRGEPYVSMMIEQDNNISFAEFSISGLKNTLQKVGYDIISKKDLDILITTLNKTQDLVVHLRNNGVEQLETTEIFKFLGLNKYGV